MVEQTQKIKFFDPHFHIFDRTENGPHGKLSEVIFPNQAYYSILDYEKLILEKDPPIEFLGGMFMEAVAPSADRIKEAFWVDKQLDKSAKSWK